MLDPISNQVLSESLNIFKSLGFSHFGSGKQGDFEAHLSTNNQFVVLKNDLMIVISGLHFYDDPAMRGALAGKPEQDRRFLWTNQDLYSRMSGMELNVETLTKLTRAGVISAAPIGIVTEDPARVEQLLKLGEVRSTEFCKEVDIPTIGTFRIYTGIRQISSVHVPQ